MSIMGAPPLLGRPPVIPRKPHASRDRDPRGVKGFWTGIARPEDAPTRTGTFTPAALPTAASAGAEPKPGHLGGGNHSAPGACSHPPAPQSQALPPRAGRPTCAGRRPAAGTRSCGTRHRAQALARAAPSPGSPRCSALCRPAEGPGRRARGPETPSPRLPSGKYECARAAMAGV